MRELELPMLAAYVDGELDDATARVVEAALRDQPDARDVVRKLRESKTWLADAFAGVLAEPVPPRLRGAIANVRPADTRPGNARPTMGGGRVAPWHSLTGITRMAAAVALLAAGGLAGFFAAELRLPQPTAPVATAPAPAQALQVLYAALEHDTSGSRVRWHDPQSGKTIGVIPVRTFLEPEDGNVCREYRREVEEAERTSVIHGVACRGATGDWAVKYELIQGAHIDIGAHL